MIGLRKNGNGNGHAKPKCPVDEALETLAREAEEVIEAARQLRAKREARSEQANRA